MIAPAILACIALGVCAGILLRLVRGPRTPQITNAMTVTATSASRIRHLIDDCPPSCDDELERVAHEASKPRGTELRFTSSTGVKTTATLDLTGAYVTTRDGRRFQLADLQERAR